MHINGNNFLAPSHLFNNEVSFAALPQVWGWASWSDRWNYFEGNPFYLNRKVLPENWSLSVIAKIAKLNHLDALMKGLDAWDYQWQMTVLNHGGLAVCPRENLISNVGVGADATHTLNDASRTFLRTGSFAPPQNLPVVENNVTLTSFYEQRMGLSFKPRLLVWMCRYLFSAFNKYMKTLARFFVFRGYTPVVVASTGRAGSTMLTNSIAKSLVQKRYYFLPSYVKKILANLAISYCDRLEDINMLNRSPVIKTHDFYRGELANRIKYIFVYGNAFDSAVSAFRQGELRGSAWLDEHIFHLCGVGSPDEVLKADVLNYEAQLKAWQNSPAFIVHYSEIWELKDELAKYLGFPFVLPTQKARSSNIPHSSLQVNRILFNRLKN